MPVLAIPLWAWLNAVILIAAGAFVWGKLSTETTPKREDAHLSATTSSPPNPASRT